MAKSKDVGSLAYWFAQYNRAPEYFQFNEHFVEAGFGKGEGLHRVGRRYHPDEKEELRSWLLEQGARERTDG